MLFVVVSLAGLAVVVAPLLSIVGFLRGRAMRREIQQLTSDVAALRSQVSGLAAQVAAARRQASPETAPRDTAAEAPPLRTAAPAADTLARPAATAAQPAATPAPSIVAPAVTPSPVPLAPAAPPPLPAVSPAASSPTASVPLSSPAARASRIPTPPGPPPSGPHVPPAPPPAPAPETPAFDWESLLGVRGAAWLGGVTLVLAALFFARWSIEQGFFSPVIRVSLLLLAGAGALLWAELKLRGGFDTTANAVSGAAVVALYAGFFAGGSLYQLFAAPVAFAGMSAVTVLAGLIAIRVAAQFTALIGLAGGLATPILLSTDVDRPVALFSYLALLAAGFLYAAERRRWPAVTSLALVGTSTLQLGWFASRMTATKAVVAVAAFILVGTVYLCHAVRTRDLPGRLQHQAAITGALLPLGLLMLMAADPQTAARWPVLLGALLIVSAGLALGSFGYGVAHLSGAAAIATGIIAALLGARHADIAYAPSALVGALIGLAAGFHLLPNLARGWARRRPSRGEIRIMAAAMVLGLTGFAWNATHGGHLPLWAFIVTIAAASAIAIDRTRNDEWPGAFVLATFALAWTCREWVVTVATPENYADHLVLPHLFAIVVAIVAATRALRSSTIANEDWYRTDFAAATLATFVAYLATFAGVEASGGFAPSSFFLLVALEVAVLVTVAIQAGWSRLIPVAAALSLLFSAAWHIVHFSAATGAPAVTTYVATYLSFVVLPFLLVRRVPAWKTRPAPWLASALVGPASFPLFDAAWRELFGTAVIGVMPVMLAAVSVSALYGISRQFGAAADPAAARQRLNYLALFATIALGFIATAIPLQLERQWLTIGWALEAAAVWWLFGRLPHAGLKYLGFGLFLAVGVRLLANPEVLAYQPRGLAIVNWLLYTYGVPAFCCLTGAYLLRGTERARGPLPAFDVLARDRELPAPIVAFLGLLLIFWLINLEIADYYSAGRYVELDLTRHLARDLTRSCAWGLYALTLLGAGLWRHNRGLRLVSLGFLLLTVAKVFLYDLGQLTGLYRIVSFLALGVSLILVSLLYQRFVGRAESPA